VQLLGAENLAGERAGGIATNQRLVARAGLFAAVAGSYLAADLASKGLGVGLGNVSAVWIPSGIAVGAALRWGWIALPAAVVGAVGGSLLHGRSGAFVALGDGLAPAVQVAAVLLLARWLGFEPALRRVRDVAVLLGAAAVASVPSAAVGAAGVSFAGSTAPDALGRIAGVWWLGDLVGITLAAPVILTWSEPGAFGRWRERGAEGVLTLAVLVVATALVFAPAPPPAGIQPALVFLSFPALLWAAFRLGPVGGATGALLSAGVAVAATGWGRGPFAPAGPGAEGLGGLVELAGFVGALALSGQILAAAASERRRAEGARAESESHLALAQRMARMGSWEWDVVADRVAWSDTLGALFGRPEGWSPSNGLAEVEPLVHPEDRHAVRRDLQRMLRDPATGDRFEAEFRVLTPDGPRWLLSAGRLLRDTGGRPLRMLGTALDVTDRKLLEQEVQQTQKMESVGRLAGGVAHDFNNLLTVIRGECELALADEGGSREHVLHAAAAAERAGALTGKLLAFARRQVLQPRVLDLGPLVSGLEPLLRRVLGEDVRLEVHLAPALWPVRADAHQLEQVIVNLAVNAREAMPRGGILRITARNGRGKDGRPEVELCVSDTGIGMDPEVREKIFEPFFTTKAHGTGLGLATCFGIVSQMGGRIEAESRPGVGTTLRVRLPRCEAAGAEAVPAPARPAARHREPDSAPGGAPVSERAPAVGGAETLLLVEDDPPIREMTRQGLEARGFRVLAAEDAESALVLARRHAGPIHLLVTDVILPGQNGRELAEQLARERPATRVLFVSGYSRDVIARRGVLEPGVELLEKPYTPSTLAERIREVLD